MANANARTDNVLVRCGYYGADAVDIAKGSSASCYFLCARVHAHAQDF